MMCIPYSLRPLFTKPSADKCNIYPPPLAVQANARTARTRRQVNARPSSIEEHVRGVEDVPLTTQLMVDDPGTPFVSSCCTPRKVSEDYAAEVANISRTQSPTTTQSTDSHSGSDTTGFQESTPSQARVDIICPPLTSTPPAILTVSLSRHDTEHVSLITAIPRTAWPSSGIIGLATSLSSTVVGNVMALGLVSIERHFISL